MKTASREAHTSRRRIRPRTARTKGRGSRRSAALHLLLPLGLFAAVIPSFGAATSANATPTAIDLGTLGGTSSYALAINDSGQIAGNSTTASGETHAFLWTQAGGMVDLGTLGGNESNVTAINDSGQVVGVSVDGSNHEHAFSWTQSGGMVDLGTFGGPSAFASDVNAGGQVVGRAHTPLPFPDDHAFSWTQSGGMVDLGTLGGRYSEATAVNDNGQIVGHSTPGADLNQRHAFLWTEAGGMVDLGTFGGQDSAARAVNSAGQVVGNSSTSTGASHAFLWTQGGGMVDLGTLGGQHSQPNAVNDNGQVVGQGDVIFGSSQYHAFSWTEAGGMIDLGTFGGRDSRSTAVNDNGQVVGTSLTTPDDFNTNHAFSWTQSGGIVDLGTLGGDDSGALALNSSGQVAGYSTTGSGERHATLWETAVTATKPDAPTNVTAVAGDGQVTVSWTAPASGGSPITGYEVVVSPSGQTVPADANATQKVITGLTNCTDFTFTVRAKNAVGTGSESTPPAAATPSTTTIVQVGENGTVKNGQAVYTPLRVTQTVDQCVRVGWTFKTTNIRNHTVTESSASAGVGLASAGPGLALFDSGLVGHGGSFGPYLFKGATFYQYRSTAAGDSNSPSLYGSVTMPVVVSPASGAIGSAFTVKWAPAPMPGYSFTIQYQFRKAGAKNWPTTWTAWLANQTGNTAAFTPIPKNGAGSYRFQARIKNSSTGKQGGWSWVDGSGLVCPCEMTVT